jgi:tetratricopeptide (TPR) repeat protein
VIERTEGNPFFIEESVRSLVETQALEGERGGYRLTRPLQSFQVPATATAMIAARVDRLTPEDKRLLQAAAVIGTDVPFALLQAVADEPEDRLRLGLAHLQATEFLYETRLFPDLEFTFRHALTHEVAYGTLLTERRRALHARIASAMEALYADRLEEHVERLAHHALRGEVWDKAVAYLRQAGTRAVARSAYREAVTCFEQALSSLARLPETRQTVESSIDLHFDLRNALQPLGEMAKLLDHLQEAERRARALDDQRRLGWASAYLSHYFWMVGRPREALSFGQNGLTIAETLGERPLGVTAVLYLGYASFTAGDYRQASSHFRKTVGLVEGGLERERYGTAVFPAAVAPTFLALALAELGEFDDGIAHGQEGIRIAEGLEHPYSLALAWSNLAGLYSVKGDLAHAVRLLERALALCREADVPVMALYVMGFLAHAYALCGRTEEGMSMGLELLTGAATMGLRSFSANLFNSIGEACLLAGRTDPALAFAGQAATMARGLGQRGGEAWALRLLGEIAFHGASAELETAEGHFHEALALAIELGMRPLTAHCHLGLGKIYARVDKPEQAREHLTTASTMFREMGMTFWLGQAEAELRGGG